MPFNKRAVIGIVFLHQRPSLLTAKVCCRCYVVHRDAFKSHYLQ